MNLRDGKILQVQNMSQTGIICGPQARRQGESGRMTVQILSDDAFQSSPVLDEGNMVDVNGRFLQQIIYMPVQPFGRWRLHGKVFNQMLPDGMWWTSTAGGVP